MSQLAGARLPPAASRVRSRTKPYDAARRARSARAAFPCEQQQRNIVASPFWATAARTLIYLDNLQGPSLRQSWGRCLIVVGATHGSQRAGGGGWLSTGAISSARTAR